MPIGPFGEVVGTTNTLNDSQLNYKSKIIAPRNPKLIKGEQAPWKMKPSQFIFQMSMDTAQKLANMHTMNVPRKLELLDMSETTHQKVSTVNIDEPMFQPYPSEIFFQRFKPFETYEIPFQLRNNDKVPRLVKVVQEDSPYFKVISPHNVGHKVGPGLPTIFKIQFTPEANKDYFHELVCITEREKFTVPVRAIGARAILDFPDDIYFPLNPVKYLGTKTIFVRNIGNRDAKFSLTTEPPFSLGSVSNLLPVDQSMQIDVNFQPRVTGDHRAEMVVHYDTGEDIYIHLHGASQNTNVRLEKNSVRIENTFISMANRRVVTIHNRSDVIAHFRWSRFATQEEEDQQRFMFTTEIDRDEDAETKRFLEECIADPSLRDKMSILSRTYHNRKKLVESDRMLFIDDVMYIEPLEGDIWPQSSADVSVVFRPEHAESYNRTAFCEVTGRESRLPLRIRGEGIGPLVTLSFDRLDIGNVFVNAAHTYEVVLANRGDIDAIYGITPGLAGGMFASCFQFDPAEGIVMPHGFQAIRITFSSPHLGDFQELFDIQVDGAREPLRLCFVGCVIGPTFHFDVAELNFGTVSYGFTNTVHCQLSNTAPVPMNYTLRVPLDGPDEVDSGHSECGKTSFGRTAKEFIITPESGTLRPNARTDVRVDLTSHTVRKYEMDIVVDVEHVGKEVLHLPLRAKCIVPPITVLTQSLDFGRCFIRYPYEQCIRLQNDTLLPTKYELLPQEVDDETPLFYSSPRPQGILEPHSVTDIPLVITAQTLGKIGLAADVIFFGNADTSQHILIWCNGEGPVVDISPLELDWGTVPVLTDISKTIHLKNASLIPAVFTTKMVRAQSVWRVEPDSGEVPPEGDLYLTVTACLDDCTKLHDKLEIRIQDSSSPARCVNMHAIGSGTTIVTDPDMTMSAVHLGAHFAGMPVMRVFQITNKGRRHQSLVWMSATSSNMLSSFTVRKQSKVVDKRDMRSRELTVAHEAGLPVFSLTPHRMELEPGASIECMLKGCVHKPTIVKERLVCHAIIGRSGGKESILNAQVNCEFISPMIELSKKEVNFYVKKFPYDELVTQVDEMDITNVSSLPLHTKLSVPYPFGLLLNEEEGEVNDAEVYLGIGSQKTVKLFFHPDYKDDKYTRIIEHKLVISYTEHPHQDKVLLTGEVHFPNLHFEHESIDFGCILNDTEVTRYVNITNSSPLDAIYRWKFFVDDDAFISFPKRTHSRLECDAETEPELPEETREMLSGGEASPPLTTTTSDMVVLPVQVSMVNAGDEDVNVTADSNEKINKSSMDVIGDIQNLEVSSKSTKEAHGADEEKRDEEKEDVADEMRITDELNASFEEELPAMNVEEQDDDDQIQSTVEPPVSSRLRAQNDTTEFQSCLLTPRGPVVVNNVLASLLDSQVPEKNANLGYEEIFDILPLYGRLQPGDSEQMTFTFYGHAHIESQVKAVCEVEGGPSYHFLLRGQASLVNYAFDMLDIDYGRIMYDQVGMAEIVLSNTGLVGFEFTAIGMDPALATRPKPGVPLLIPNTGYIEPHHQMSLQVRILPGVPTPFHKSFGIQVAHFEPDIVSVRGEGVFPRISLDLPRILSLADESGDDPLAALVKEVKENLSAETSKATEHKSSVVAALSSADNINTQELPLPSDVEIQMEVERLVVTEFAKELHESMDRANILTLNAEDGDTSVIINEPMEPLLPQLVSRKAKIRPRLPDYLLDFGHVILGTVRTHIVRATNQGWYPASFAVDRDYMNLHGFSIELHRVRMLPGAPDHQSVDFVVSFDPRGANLDLGPVEAVVPINVLNGPQICIRMKAIVTMPSLLVSSEVLEFSEVICGECQVLILQLHNHQQVRCEWQASVVLKDDSKIKVDKHLPLHLRRKLKIPKPKINTFEMVPAHGFLLPGQRQNVQVKFMPTEQKSYECHITVKLAQSSQRVMIVCRGNGLEPDVQFDRNLVEFGPVLPHSGGDEQEIVVHNPCSFPIEIYNLEFDKMYLEEEKVLRLMKGYDENNVLLLPPRAPTEKLPQELLEYYEEQLKKFEEMERNQKEAEAVNNLIEQTEPQSQSAADEDASSGVEADTKPDAAAAAASAAAATLPVATPRTGRRASFSKTAAVVPKEKEKKEKKKEKEEEERETEEREMEGPMKESDPLLKEMESKGDVTGKPAEADDGPRESAQGIPADPLVGEPEVTPVLAAIARHLGIDLTMEGKAARNRRGIAIVVHGAPMSGKTTASITLAKTYEVALLTVDGIVMEAITAGNSIAGMKARQLCADAARRHAEEEYHPDAEEAERKPPGGLSVEAVTAHTQLGAGGPSLTTTTTAAHSIGQGSNRKLANVDAKGTRATKTLASSVEATSQVPMSPPPGCVPAQKLSVAGSIAGEDGLMSTVLPPEVLIEILAERLMLNDCHRGVIIDGLESLFSSSQFSTAQSVLRAFNNRKYIYFVTLKHDFNALKEAQHVEELEREHEQQIHILTERQKLEEMDEDEYDALPEAEKQRVDSKRLQIKKERLRRELEEKQERERIEKEAWEAEQRRLEEERVSKKKRRQEAGKDGKKAGLEGSAGGKKATESRSQERTTMPTKAQLDGAKKSHTDANELTKNTASVERADSRQTERGESALDAQKRKSTKEGKRPDASREKYERTGKDGEVGTMDEGTRDSRSDPDILLMHRFRNFEYSLKEISDLLDNWERALGATHPPTPIDSSGDLPDDPSHPHPPSGKKGKKDKHDKTKDKESDKKSGEKSKSESKDWPSNELTELMEGEVIVDPVQQQLLEERRQKRLLDGIGVPHIVLDRAEGGTPAELSQMILQSGKLPDYIEVLDGLGLGPTGPPIPPPANFAVTPYPVKRHAPPGADGGHYVFVAATVDDPNLGLEEKIAEEEPTEEEKPMTPTKEDVTPTKSTRKGRPDDKLAADSRMERKSRKGSGKTNKQLSGGGRGEVTRKLSTSSASPPPPNQVPSTHGAHTPASELDSVPGEGAGGDLKAPSICIYRWVIPANGDVTLKLRFTSDQLGQFDQTLNFEIMGTRRRYQLYCRGICAFPTISREPRIVFPHRKKSKKPDEIIHKKYILTSEMFDFGPLLVGKSRDKYKEGRYPENMETINICNTSPLESDVSFCFLSDSRAETFLLDPPSMLLKPGDSQKLNIWAYPKAKGVYEDSLVCCVKENPEPILFKVVCSGERPELELDKKILHFDKVLIHRKDTKTLYLRNSTLLPVAWHMTGLEALGDDFSLSQESGVIEPKTEFPLYAYFRALKPLTTSKKVIRLEVSDKDNIIGLVQTENIQVHAEAYDVALDMSFPKGADGGIDFDIMRVHDEQKQTCSLKNKGKYDIAYSFSLEPTEGCPASLCSLFSVVPNKGTLSPSDRPAPVQVIFRANQELAVRDQPILRCQVIEPNISDSGETIASIPIKVSVKAVYSKYRFFPTNDINFGPMLVSSKKVRTFTIENYGERFEFKYTISRMLTDSTKHEEKKNTKHHKGDKHVKSGDGSSSGRSAGLKPKKTDSVRQETTGVTNQGKLTIGAYTIYPAFGYILAGSHQVITVECVPEVAGNCEEVLSMDITGRDHMDHPQGIPYRLLADACQPGISVGGKQVSSVFEEHRICKNLSLWQLTHRTEQGGVYGEDENRFVFNNVLVGHRATARFKLLNDSKVPCDIISSVRMLNTATTRSTKHQPPEAFEVEPSRIQVPAHSHSYVTVSFLPTSLQSYTGVYEAVTESTILGGVKMPQLTFEISGEGNLPRISIDEPSQRNKKGQPLMLFKRFLVQRSQVLPLTISNDGTLACKVDMDLVDPDSAFSLKPTGDTRAVMSGAGDCTSECVRRPHTASVVINVGESATFDVTFTPLLPQRSQAHIRLSVIDNQYEDALVLLVGEGYLDDITLDNVTSADLALTSPIGDGQEQNLAEDDVAAAKSNLMNFGDCYIGEARTLTFSLTNHSSTDCVRFQWPMTDPHIKFSPAVGHLHPSCSKAISVTFLTDDVRSMQEQAVPCSISKINFNKPIDEVPQWDDHVRVVKWVDNNDPRPPTGTSGSNDSNPKSSLPTPSPSMRPLKRKVVETEPEPQFTEVADSQRTIELLVSAVADHCKAKCKTESIHFKATPMLQTTVYEFALSNKGNVYMEYNWTITDEQEVSPTLATEFSPVTQHAIATPRPAECLIPVRPSSAVSSEVSDSPYTPFIVEPECGTIAPGKKANITVKFSPLGVGEYEAQLVCSVPNIDPQKRIAPIALLGRSTLPYCHFELTDSDYIRSGRRNPEMRGPHGAPAGTTLDPNTRVVEMHTIGVGVCTRRMFFVVNPTAQAYTFLWRCEDEVGAKMSVDFICLDAEREVRSGKRTEVAFEFTSSKLGVTESFWTFTIPELNLSLPFLFVGHTTDPLVDFDRSHLNFKSLLIGYKATETFNLINSAPVEIPFSFVAASLTSPGHSAVLYVQPMSGVIAPNTSLPITASFQPDTDKEVNFNVCCKIKTKAEPLMINIKAEGYTMECLILCENSAGEKIEISADHRNEIHFNQVEVNERATYNLFIVNSGKFNFDYIWEWRECRESQDGTVSLTPTSGSVAHGTRATCRLTFCPTRQMVLSGMQMLLKITDGPSYRFKLYGTAIVPDLHFSFVSFDFGPSFVYRAGLQSQSIKLQITNSEKKDISIECLYENTPHLTHNFIAHVLPPDNTTEVIFTFYPRAAIAYHEVVKFVINGLSHKSVEFRGQGTEMRVEVCDPRHKMIRLGALRVGKVVKQVVPIINRSPAPLTFRVNLNPTNHALVVQKALRLTPNREITLAPQGVQDVEVVFAPTARVAPFTEEVMLECAGLDQPLFVLTGSCHGIDIQLATSAIPFGAVVQNSSSVRRLLMYNHGDVGASFQWNCSKFKPNFSINPDHGYISPGMHIPFDITFKPQELNNDIRCDNLRCQIEGAPSLRLTLTGMCIAVPPSKDVLNFSAAVRTKDVRNLSIPNRTNMHWHIRPVIDGEQWTGPEMFDVEPQTTRQYELTYLPLTMTTEGKHTGTVFFPLPDGTGLLYNMQGTADAPKANGRITRDMPCKTTYTEMLPVHNWLKVSQRFRVKFEMIRPEKMDHSTLLKGLDYIDVPGNSSNDYKISFYSYKESQTQFKVTFMNEGTQEYQYYELLFRAGRPGVISTIELASPVRQVVPYTISLENPLPYGVTFSANCSVSEIMMPSHLQVPAESQGTFNIEYLPLKVGEHRSKLEFNCSDLGLYIYELNLKGTPAGPERPLYFRANLGSYQVQSAKFLNYAKVKTDYTCKIDNPDFHIDKTVAASPGSSSGTEVSVDVTYEPSCLGESRGVLTLSAPAGGDYTVPLFGTCIPAKPQGPFNVKAGATTTVMFRNVFPHTTAFTFQVDNPMFHVTKPGETIRSHKDHRIIVGFDGSDSGSKAAVMGRLVVSCARSAGGNSNAQWVFYLKGITP